MRDFCHILFSILTIITLIGCSSSKTGETSESTDSFALPDTLRVGTLYSPTSYFIYRDETLGFDYKLIKAFCEEKSITMNIQVAPSLEKLIEMLDSGKIDIVTYEVPITAEYKRRAYACGPVSTNSQVLVQPLKDKSSKITDVTQLVGKDVYVEKNSKYQYRLENLNEELGGGINIHAVNRDTLITEDLIQMVSDGTIPLTVVDSDIARINKTYYKNLDITLPISFPQRSAWAVAQDNSWLGDSINSWLKLDENRQAYAWLLKRYFELAKNETIGYSLDLSKGRISVYDNLFKHYSKIINWDWRLIAAQGYVESRFDNTVISWVGAKGIMQVMPSTARALGLDPDDIVNPDPNIRTAVEILRILDKSFASKVPDHNERKKFVVAAYNSGAAHIYDAIAIAKRIGKNPAIWENNVADALLLKANPDIYNDTSICKYGYFRGRQTCTYVKEVFSVYNKCKNKIPL